MWQLPSMLGSLCVIDASRVILALQNGLHEFDLTTEALTLIHDPEPNEPKTRLNDGKTDRQGQFLFASMGVKDRTRGWGGLYRLKHDFTVEQLLSDVIVGNGPCFSPMGDTLYFSNGRGVMNRYDYDPTGPLSQPQSFFDARALGLACDGATVDAQGNIWTALIGSGSIGCIEPTGKLKRTIDLPIPLPSSVMFGGQALSSLFVTSIRDSGNRRDDHPQSGLVFNVEGLGYEGIEETPFYPKL
jgi:sugar lactone lactonase YvrE